MHGYAPVAVMIMTNAYSGVEPGSISFPLHVCVPVQTCMCQCHCVCVCMRVCARLCASVRMSVCLSANQLESACANYSTIAFMPREDCDRNTQNEAYDNQVKHHLKYLFAYASTKDKDEIYPVTVSEITAAQQNHRLHKKYFKDKPFKGKYPLISLMVISETKVLVYKDKRLVIPTKIMQSKVVQWYHQYLQHPGKNRLEETMVAIMRW